MFAMIRRSMPLLMIATLSLASAWAQSDSPRGDSAKPAKGIAYWVTQLGNENYLRRETASKKLIESGPDAIAELVQVIREGELEVVERATDAITAIALVRPPSDDGGAWDELQQLASHAAGRRASGAKAAVAEIRRQRAVQAREALAAAGAFVGIDEFTIGAISQPRTIVQIDDRWRGDVESLQWLRWLSGVQYARIKGSAVTADVLESITQVPGLQSLAIIDGKVDDETLQPLTKMHRIHSLEFRYVPLTDDQGDLISSMPIRVALHLMGTGISEQKVDSMKSALPGLQIVHRQGGFLGVKCMDSLDACEINEVVNDSAAAEAGLLKGDVIVRVGDVEVNRFRDLQKAINLHRPGDELEIKFQRGEKIESVKLRLRRFEEP